MKKLACLMLAVLLLIPCLAGCGEKEVEPPFEATFPTVPGPTGTSDEEILAYRRDLVEQQMRNQVCVRWTPSETIEYSLVFKSQGLAADKISNPADIITFRPGRIYEGIPYTHGRGSGYDFLAYGTSYDETGVLVIGPLTHASLGGGTGSLDELATARIGNDCADMLFWAWGHVSTTIGFEHCMNMVPANGVLPVGDYTGLDTSLEKILYTNPICEENGEQKMYECYAQLQKGDGMVHMNKQAQGHAIMNVKVNVVRNADGTIDPQKSYCNILDQNSGGERTQTDAYKDETTGQIIYRLDIPDREMTFAQLYKTGYLPVTCKELIDPSPLPEVTITDSVKEPSIDNIFDGIVNCPYRISNVTITIQDEKGNTVQEATMFGLSKEMYDFNLQRFKHNVEQTVIKGSIKLDALESGTYTVTHTARIATGEKIPFRTFTFTK